MCSSGTEEEELLSLGEVDHKRRSHDYKVFQVGELAKTGTLGKMEAKYLQIVQAFFCLIVGEGLPAAPSQTVPLT